ncbi:hypothetical protein AB0K60_03600 [Thermopolyspora sp. NPDC052614]|uniref:hypothetical protein n=1 Tax=Thermopolyspora sp. NPDC052614 TaxID=3155682 RepID=UPI00342A3C8B
MPSSTAWRAPRAAWRPAIAMAAVIPVLASALPATAHAADPRPPAASGASGEAFQRGREVGVRLANSTIKLTGHVRGGKTDGHRLKRPCWYEPDLKPAEMLKQQEGLRAIWRHFNPDATDEDFERFLQQFRDRLDDDGRWWKPAYNAADPAGQACWSGLEAFVFVPTGTTPAGGITVRELAEIARAALTVPEPRLKLSPEAKSYVNLPTFVWLPGSTQATRSVTATLPGVMSATVTATRTGIEIDPGTTADRAEVKNQCGAAGRPYVKDAPFTCGVRYLRASLDRPRGVYELTVTTVWRVAVTSTQPIGGPGFTPIRAATTIDVPVGEVQSTVRDSTS